MFLDRGNDNMRSKWIEWYSYNRTAILSLIANWIKDEGIFGYSCKQYLLQQYYFAFYYTYLIYMELSYGQNTSLEYYENKYNIEDITKKLLCNNIQLSKLFDIFGIEFTNEETVIQSIEIQNESCIGFICESKLIFTEYDERIDELR